MKLTPTRMMIKHQFQGAAVWVEGRSLFGTLDPAPNAPEAPAWIHAAITTPVETWCGYLDCVAALAFTDRILLRLTDYEVRIEGPGCSGYVARQHRGRGESTRYAAGAVWGRVLGAAGGDPVMLRQMPGHLMLSGDGWTALLEATGGDVAPVELAPRVGPPVLIARSSLRKRPRYRPASHLQELDTTTYVRRAAVAAWQGEVDMQRLLEVVPATVPFIEVHDAGGSIRVSDPGLRNLDLELAKRG